MQSVLHDQSTFLDMLRSTTAEYLPTMHWNSVVLKQPVSRLHAHLQATPVDQFQENHDFVEQSASQGPTTVSLTIPSQKLTLKLT
jgi:hypothetical protein